jgi:hypothetical protein
VRLGDILVASFDGVLTAVWLLIALIALVIAGAAMMGWRP